MEHRPYYSLNQYYRELFGHKVYKISLNAGMTCPNRDGTLGRQGCIFCSAGGSGDFAADYRHSITAQIDEGIERISSKFTGSQYIAYFQAFTNTYAPVEVLQSIFTEAVSDERIAGLSIATRPDCLESDVIELLARLNTIKPVWIELGLQTSNEHTARYIRRGYPLLVYDQAAARLRDAGIPFVTHMIIGLPGENMSDYLATARHIADSHAQGIKLQLLHILQGTDLALDYEKGLFQAMSLEEYVQSVVNIIEILPPDMVIHRITGDGPRKLLIAPLWSCNKKNVLNSINREFINRNTYQGKEFR